MIGLKSKAGRSLDPLPISPMSWGLYALAGWPLCLGDYRYTSHLHVLERCRSWVPPRLPGLSRAVTSPLQWPTWAECLTNHPDRLLADYQGIRDGFRIGFNYANSCKKATKNMGSALEKPGVVRDYLAEECTLGRIIGPLYTWLYPTVQVSRFGVIPKTLLGDVLVSSASQSQRNARST